VSDSDTPQHLAFRAAIWLVAAMIAVPLVAVFGVQHFKSARHNDCGFSCSANLKQIDGAVQQWALENKMTATDTYSLSDPALLALLKGSHLPECPNHGRYLSGTNIGATPRCSIGGLGHTLCSWR